MRKEPTRGPPLSIERPFKDTIIISDKIYWEATTHAELHNHNYLVFCSRCRHGILALMCKINYFIDTIESVSCRNMLVAVGEELGSRYKLEDYIVRAVKANKAIIIVIDARLLTRKDLTGIIESVGCSMPLSAECYYSAYGADEIIDLLLYQYTVLQSAHELRVGKNSCLGTERCISMV